MAAILKHLQQAASARHGTPREASVGGEIGAFVSFQMNKKWTRVVISGMEYLKGNKMRSCGEGSNISTDITKYNFRCMDHVANDVILMLTRKASKQFCLIFGARKNRGGRAPVYRHAPCHRPGTDREGQVRECCVERRQQRF